MTSRLKTFVTLCILLTTQPATATPATEPWPHFSTAGHPKSHGLNVTVSYPSGWKAEETKSPRAVQVFDNGKDAAVLSIDSLNLPKILTFGKTIHDIPLSVTKPVPNCETVSTTETEVKGHPSLEINASCKYQLGETTIYSRMKMFHFLIEGRTVALTLNVGSETPELSERMKAVEPTFMKMLDSLELPPPARCGFLCRLRDALLLSNMPVKQNTADKN
jgi:hypothetical protein